MFSKIEAKTSGEEMTDTEQTDEEEDMTEELISEEDITEELISEEDMTEAEMTDDEEDMTELVFTEGLKDMKGTKGDIEAGVGEEEEDHITRGFQYQVTHSIH